jgi:regulator of sigma E protease
LDKSDASRAFSAKPVWKRLIVFAAGSIMNAVLALTALFVIYSINGVSIPGSYTSVVQRIVAGMPAESAGFLTGDRLFSVNGEELGDQVFSVMINNSMAATPGQSIDVGIIRDGEHITINVIPHLNRNDEGIATGYVIGISIITLNDYKTGLFARMPDNAAAPRAGFGETVRESFNSCVSMVSMVFQALRMLTTREVGVGELMGPIGLVSFIGDVYEFSANIGMSAVIESMLRLMALISINLAIFNFLPLPALDGGRIVFPEIEAMIHGVGPMLLMGLLIFVTWNDIARTVIK